MTSYIVIELQTSDSGGVGNVVTTFDNQPQAYSKYYTVLAAAAVSAIPKHAAVLMTSEGYLMESRCFEHAEGGEQ